MNLKDKVTPFLYGLVTATVICVVLYFLLLFKGCEDIPSLNKSHKDSVAITPAATSTELSAKPLSAEGQKVVTKWKMIRDSILITKTDTLVVYDGGECEDFEHKDTINRKINITVIEDNERTNFDVEENLPIAQIVGCSVGQSLLTLGESHLEIEMSRKRLPISVGGQSLVTLKPFFEYDLVNAKAWKIGARLQLSFDPLGIYTAPNANPEHALSFPVGVDYKVWELK